MRIQELEERFQSFSKTVDQEEARRDLICENLKKNRGTL